MENRTPRPVTLARRLAAMLYDGLLLFSLLFAITLFVILPLNRGHAIQSEHPLFQVFILFIMYLYFAWQWTHGGQTLGMRAWKIRLVSGSESAVNWWQASLRFLLAILSAVCLCLGYIWSLFNSQGQTWHDRYSGTRLVFVHPDNS